MGVKSEVKKVTCFGFIEIFIAISMYTHSLFLSPFVLRFCALTPLENLRTFLIYAF